MAKKKEDLKALKEENPNRYSESNSYTNVKAYSAPDPKKKDTLTPIKTKTTNTSKSKAVIGTGSRYDSNSASGNPRIYGGTRLVPIKNASKKRK